jgi:hypothetical protein
LLLASSRFLSKLASRVGGQQLPTEPGREQRDNHDYLYYSAGSLEQSLVGFEQHFGMTTVAFLEKYERDELPAGVSRHAANVWAGVAAEFERLQRDVKLPDDLLRAAIAK